MIEDTLPEIVFGVNPVLEALLAGKRAFNKVVVAKGIEQNRILQILRLAREKKIPIQYADRRQLDKLTERGNHQGIAAQIAPMGYKSLEEIIAKAKLKGPEALICLLDEITDPHNLGAIIRSAEVLGADGIVITKHNSCPVTGTVEKASAGAIEHIPVARVDSLAKFIDKLKNEGFWIAGADSNGKTCYETDLRGPLALVIGSEDKGLKHLVKEKCDFLISIPMAGKVASLNASCAASVLLYEIGRQRKMVDKRP
jgi:23S rRNA (guanosine2251-2'-O)-methyltransferase